MANRELMSIEIKMLKPRNDIEHCLNYGSNSVVYEMPSIEGTLTIEIYEAQYNQASVSYTGYEWRLIDINKTEVGIARKVVKFDSYEGGYSNPRVALRDAILFSSINNI